MPINKLRDFLDNNEIKYVVLSHSTAYTAQEVAASAHIPGKEMAKTVILKVDGKMMMAVLPANYKVDFTLLKNAIGADKVILADEQDFMDQFPECEIGAMPPFGNLYNMDVLVAESLSEDDSIAFNAGSHRELVKMGYKDFEKLVNPRIVKYSVRC